MEGGGTLIGVGSCASWDAGALGECSQLGLLCLIETRVPCCCRCLGMVRGNGPLSRAGVAFPAGVGVRDDGIPLDGGAARSLRWLRYLAFTCMMYLYDGCNVNMESHYSPVTAVGHVDQALMQGICGGR